MIKIPKSREENVQNQQFIPVSYFKIFLETIFDVYHAGTNITKLDDMLTLEHAM